MKDESRVKEWLKMWEELNSYHLEVGIFGEDDGNMLMIANVNEFGMNITVTPKMRGYLAAVLDIHLKKETTTINIPERSFVRGSYDKNLNGIIERGEDMLEKVLALEEPVDSFFKKFGEIIRDMTKEYLIDLRDPPNHPATLKAKAPKSNPLVNHSHLVGSITYKVVKN